MAAKNGGSPVFMAMSLWLPSDFLGHFRAICGLFGAVGVHVVVGLT